MTDRNDIVEVVSSYVRLSKRSGANYFGLCPFHSEKTPSFSVSPDRQSYHCFGCGKGGDVIGFIMEIENLSFPEAVEFLAKRANMKLPEEVNDRESKKRARMLALNRDAARWFYEQLHTPQAQIARAYMEKRRIGPATAKNFGLGYAPNNWRDLMEAMRAKGYTDQELFEAGLIRRRERSSYDTFRNRLMFPVIDVRGNVIGFSGRILDDGEPKYMNSPDTLVFDKGRNLFALNLAKKSKSGYIILSEGNIDVVSLHQAGFDSAVASLGTSLTGEQARLISRYTNEVIIAYDGDGAGVKASQRAIGILEKLDLKVRVLRMSGAKDPDELIRTKGPEAFRALLEASENQVDYRLRSIAARYVLDSPEQKYEFLKEAYGVVARLPDQAQRDLYASRLAEQVGVKEDAVRGDVEKTRSQLIRRARSSETRASARAGDRPPAAQGRKLYFDDPRAAAAEQGLIRLLFLDAGCARGVALPEPREFSSPELRHIYEALCERIERHAPVSLSLLRETLSSEEVDLLVRLDQEPVNLSNGEQAMADYISIIHDRYAERQAASAQKRASDDLMAMRDKYRATKAYK